MKNLNNYDQTEWSVEHIIVFYEIECISKWDSNCEIFNTLFSRLMAIYIERKMHSINIFLKFDLC